MFLPSEAVYAELHANFTGLVEESFRARVWIVSPTTLMATLNTVRAILKDVRMREQADVIQAEMRKLLDDVRRLDDRVLKLQQHFDQASEDIRKIRISTDKVTPRRRADRGPAARRPGRRGRAPDRTRHPAKAHEDQLVSQSADGCFGQPAPHPAPARLGSSPRQASASLSPGEREGPGAKRREGEGLVRWTFEAGTGPQGRTTRTR